MSKTSTNHQCSVFSVRMFECATNLLPSLPYTFKMMMLRSKQLLYETIRFFTGYLFIFIFVSSLVLVCLDRDDGDKQQQQHPNSNPTNFSFLRTTSTDTSTNTNKAISKATSRVTSTTTTFPDKHLVFDLMQLSVDIFAMDGNDLPADAITNPKYKLELFIEADFSTHAMIVTPKQHDEIVSSPSSSSLKSTDTTTTTTTRKTCIVVYRGSDDINDWLVDLNIELEKSKFINAPDDVMVHRGFQNALFGQNITGIVEDKVLELCGGGESSNGAGEAEAEVIVTGHSLGGANAHITGAFLANKYPNMKITVINFGCPRLGNNAFKSWTEETLTNLSVWRFVYRADIVPRIIPRKMGYKHAGHLFMMYRKLSKVYYHQTGLQKIYMGAPWSWYCTYI